MERRMETMLLCGRLLSKKGKWVTVAKLSEREFEIHVNEPSLIKYGSRTSLSNCPNQLGNKQRSQRWQMWQWQQCHKRQQGPLLMFSNGETEAGVRSDLWLRDSNSSWISAPSALYIEFIAKNEANRLWDFGASFKGWINHNHSNFSK